MTGSVIDGAGAGANNVPALWRAIFGDGEGYLCVASGLRDGERLRDFRERYFRYPEQAEDAAGHARDEDEAGRETYFCAHLLREERRAKGTATPIHALYADGDGAQVPEDVPEPSVVVESSPGRTQLYWLLSRPVEPGAAERLNRRLARAVGADMSGWDLTQLLRVPGTRNRKYADAPGVSIAETTGEMHDPEELDRDLPELPEEHNHDGGELSEPVSPEMSDEEILRLCRRSRSGEKFTALYDEGDTSDYGGDRSSADMALVSILSFYTQDREQIDRLFRNSALMRQKWNRVDYRDRTIRKALAGRTAFYGQEYDLGEVTFIEDDAGPGAYVETASVTGIVTTTNAADVTDAAAGGGAPRTPPSGVPPFPVDSLPPVLANMTREVSASLVCQPELVAVPMLSAFAAAIGASRVLEVKGGWREFPSLWTATVADPSSKKTPAQQRAVEPAEGWQIALKKQHEVAVRDHEEDLREWEGAKAGIKKGDVPPKKPEPPVMKHNLVQDITVEALAVKLEQNPRGLLASHDELSGFFRSMDQYKPGGKGDERQKFLSLWSSRMLKVDRKGGDSIVVERPVVSITGGIQPDVLSEMAPQGKADKDDGMIHRFLFAFPEPWLVVDDWSDAEVSAPTGLRYGWVYERLHGLEPGEDGKPVVVRFTDAGRERFKEEHRATRGEMFRPGFPARLKHTWSKMGSHLARLALVLALVRSAAEGSEEVVGEEDVEKAARLLTYFKASAYAMHLRVQGESKDERLLRVLDRFLDDHDGSWKGPSEELRTALLEGSVHDVPDRAEDLTTKLLKLSEEDGAFLVKRGWKGKDRAVTVSRKKPQQGASAALPAGAGVGNVGNVGASNAVSNAGETVGNAADLVRFALKDGPAYPDELADRTGLAYGTAKRVVSELRKSGEIEDTGVTKGQSRQVRLPAPLVLDARFLGSHDENERKGA